MPATRTDRDRHGGERATAWSPVTRSDDRWSDDPAGWAMPTACARHLRRAATWMGAVAALAGALSALVLVVVLWLLQASTSGSPTGAMRAGVLLFLAAQHGGAVVDGETVRFLPLGVLLPAAVLPWRAGRSLAALADHRGQRARLRGAFARLVAGYVGACVVLLVLGRVGSSHAPLLTTLPAAAVLVTVVAGAGVRRELTRRDGRGFVPPAAAPVVRAAGAAGLVLATSSALLVAVSLALHAGRVTALSAAVGGGVAGVPLLLLGVVSAPNAVVAVGSLLAGPGFAVGTDTVVSLGGTRHGLLPSLPLLGALPGGSGPHPLVIAWAAVTAVAMGLAVARGLGRPGRLVDLARRLLGAAAVGAAGTAVLAALAGGGLGSGRLRAVGASPWQAGLAVGAEIAVSAALVLAVRAVVARVQALGRPRVAVAVDATADPQAETDDTGTDVTDDTGTDDTDDTGTDDTDVTGTDDTDTDDTGDTDTDGDTGADPAIAAGPGTAAGPVAEHLARGA